MATLASRLFVEGSDIDNFHVDIAPIVITQLWKKSKSDTARLVSTILRSLENVPFIKPLTHNQKLNLIQSMILRSYEPDEVLIQQGEENGQFFFVLVSGQVSIRIKSEKTPAIDDAVSERAHDSDTEGSTDNENDCTQNERMLTEQFGIEVVQRNSSETSCFFGETALIGKGKRTASILAIRDCTCALLSYSVFEAALEKHRKMMQKAKADAIAKSISRRGASSSNRISHSSDTVGAYLKHYVPRLARMTVDQLTTLEDEENERIDDAVDAAIGASQLYSQKILDLTEEKEKLKINTQVTDLDSTKRGIRPEKEDINGSSHDSACKHKDSQNNLFRQNSTPRNAKLRSPPPKQKDMKSMELGFFPSFSGIVNTSELHLQYDDFRSSLRVAKSEIVLAPQPPKPVDALPIPGEGFGFEDLICPGLTSRQWTPEEMSTEYIAREHHTHIDVEIPSGEDLPRPGMEEKRDAIYQKTLKSHRHFITGPVKSISQMLDEINDKRRRKREAIEAAQAKARKSSTRASTRGSTMSPKTPASRRSSLRKLQNLSNNVARASIATRDSTSRRESMKKSPQSRRQSLVQRHSQNSPDSSRVSASGMTEIDAAINEYEGSSPPPASRASALGRTSRDDNDTLESESVQQKSSETPNEIETSRSSAVDSSMEFTASPAPVSFVQVNRRPSLLGSAIQQRRGSLVMQELHEGYNENKQILIDPSARKMSSAGTEHPIPLTQTLQERLELIFRALCMPASQRLVIVLKYTSPDWAMYLKDMVAILESATDYILKREDLLARLEKFETAASDPRRLLHGSTTVDSKHRLREEHSRKLLLKHLKKITAQCGSFCKQLEDEYMDIVSFRGIKYLDKMANDQSQLLFSLENKRMQFVAAHESNI